MHTQPFASPITPPHQHGTPPPAAPHRLHKYGAPLPVMGIASSSSSNPETIAMALAKAKEVAASAPVVVFSKSYCPFCTRVKQLFTKLGATFKAIELDVEGDGADIQSALAQWTGQRTVPNVFINGKHIGGCDDTLALEKSGKLVPLLQEAGAITGSASKTTMTA